MKKLAFIIIVLLLTSCAGRQQTPYVIPDFIRERPAATDFAKAYNCLNLREDGENSRLRITGNQEPNGWIDKNNDVFLTEGIFRYDDNVIIFVMAHELSHAKLKHVRNKQLVSYATTGAMMVIGFIIPGAGLLNHAINPAVTNNFSKSQEYDADRLASETLVKCFNISVDKQIHILETLKNEVADGGGFWAQHPSWDDRIENIKQPPR